VQYMNTWPYGAMDGEQNFMVVGSEGQEGKNSECTGSKMW
jgi:hypothetical protein